MMTIDQLTELFKEYVDAQIKGVHIPEWPDPPPIPDIPTKEQIKEIAAATVQPLNKSLEVSDDVLNAHAGEIAALKQMIEDQNKQIESLTMKVSESVQLAVATVGDINGLNETVDTLQADHKRLQDHADRNLTKLALEQDDLTAKLDGDRDAHVEATGKLSAKMDTLETRVLSAMDTQIKDVNEWLHHEASELQKNIEDVEKMLDDNLHVKSEQIRLEMSERQSKEYMRLSDFINSRLDTLKGEKGEKGSKGDNGFLQRVSLWEDGSIAKENEVHSYKNGLWFCKVEQTAKTPCIGDEWDLICNSLYKMGLSDGRLIAELSNGERKDYGRVTPDHVGEWEEGVTYAKNNIVTLDKTSFISQEDNNANRPPSNNWKLLAGKGEKGKQGKQGEAGIQLEHLENIIDDRIDKAIGGLD